MLLRSSVQWLTAIFPPWHEGVSLGPLGDRSSLWPLFPTTGRRGKCFVWKSPAGTWKAGLWPPLGLTQYQTCNFTDENPKVRETEFAQVLGTSWARTRPRPLDSQSLPFPSFLARAGESSFGVLLPISHSQWKHGLLTCRDVELPPVVPAAGLPLTELAMACWAHAGDSSTRSLDSVWTARATLKVQFTFAWF